MNAIPNTVQNVFNQWASNFFADTSKLNALLVLIEMQGNFIENSHVFISKFLFKKLLRDYANQCGWEFNPTELLDYDDKIIRMVVTPKALLHAEMVYFKTL